MDQFKGASLDCLRSTRPVFRGLDFDLPAGGALVLTGPNGSGKSSLLRLMAGLLPPAGGTLSWNGEPVAEDPDAHRARLAYLGHLDAVKPALTAAENLAFWAQLEGADPATAVGPALDALAIGHLADLPARLRGLGRPRGGRPRRLAGGRGRALARARGPRSRRAPPRLHQRWGQFIQRIRFIELITI